jgi:hypothetical protein
MIVKRVEDELIWSLLLLLVPPHELTAHPLLRPWSSNIRRRCERRLVEQNPIPSASRIPDVGLRLANR